VGVWLSDVGGHDGTGGIGALRLFQAETVVVGVIAVLPK
jgi:hypothetical protein